MKKRKPKSDQSRQLISRTMKKRWAERKERQKQLKEEADRQHAATVRADYLQRKKAGLLTLDELEKEREQREHDKKRQRRYARESEWRRLHWEFRRELADKKVLTLNRALILAARYFQKMYLTPREERCITTYVQKLNSKDG